MESGRIKDNDIYKSRLLLIFRTQVHMLQTINKVSKDRSHVRLIITIFLNIKILLTYLNDRLKGKKKKLK